MMSSSLVLDETRRDMSNARDEDDDIVFFSSLSAAVDDGGTLEGEVYVSLLGFCSFFVTDADIEENDE